MGNSKKNKPLQIGLIIVIALLSLFIITVIGIKIYSELDNPFLVVVSESMIPNLNVGDLVLKKNKQADGNDDSMFDNLKIGDIIVFSAPNDRTADGKPRIVVHRIVDIEDKEDSRETQTPATLTNAQRKQTTTISEQKIDNMSKQIKQIQGLQSEKSISHSKIIRTKGDANPKSYDGLDYPIKKENYKGKVFFVIPKIGLFVQTFINPK